MKYILIFCFLYACKYPANKPITEVNNATDTPAVSTSSAALKASDAMARYNLVLSVVGKRDSFNIKKYENEVLYYQTTNERYRLRANRCIDSFNKYVRIIDSLAKAMNVKRNK
jgi:hypothetical protein